MSPTQPKIEAGGWTPSLRTLAAEVMDELILRQTSLIISDPRNGSQNTFQGIREKILKKRYIKFSEWKDDFLNILSTTRMNMIESNPLIVDICDDYEKEFLKKYEILEKMSLFMFKDVLSNIANEIRELI